jgi:type IX secretion system PorP/SprF family membrane protein
MKRLYTALLILLGVGMMQAQDFGVSIKLPIAFQQYFLNPQMMNPAQTGFHGKYRVAVNYRNQWSDFPGAPQSFAASYNGPATDRVGIGALLFTEQFGVQRHFRGQLSYAYKFGTEDYDMALGLSTDFSQFRLSNQAITNSQYDPNDPLVLDALDGRRFFGASVGFFAKYKEQFYFGLSLPQVVFSRIDDGEGDGETELNYIASIGTWIDLPDYDMKIEPSIYLKKIGNIDLHVDFNVVANFLDQRLFGGLSYSVGAGDRFGFLVGARVNNFRVFYGYDVSYQDFQEYNNGAHEITVNFDLFSNFQKTMEEQKMQKIDPQG